MGNRIVLAILFSALLICVTIYYTGSRSERTPAIGSEGANQISAGETIQATPTPTVDDLAVLTKRISEKSGIPLDNIQITISKRIGTYARGGVVEKTSQVGGAAWWAAFADGTWTVVHIGQDYPNCTSLVGYSFPKELLDGCWDDETNSVKTL